MVLIMPTQDELIGNKMNCNEIEQFLKVNKLIFQKKNDLVKSITDINPKLNNFDLSIFDGNYVFCIIKIIKKFDFF